VVRDPGPTPATACRQRQQVLMPSGAFLSGALGIRTCTSLGTPVGFVALPLPERLELSEESAIFAAGHRWPRAVTLASTPRTEHIDVDKADQRFDALRNSISRTMRGWKWNAGVILRYCEHWFTFPVDRESSGATTVCLALLRAVNHLSSPLRAHPPLSQAAVRAKSGGNGFSPGSSCN
jgi:hypothetical protein